MSCPATPQSPFWTPLTAHFALGELALGQEQRRFHHQHQVETARKLCLFLERVRGTFGGPVIITSGYRPAAINRAVGGAVNSEHLYSAANTGAVDFFIPQVDLVAVERYCSAEWPHSLGLAARAKGFIHLGMRAGAGRLRWDY